MNKLGHYEFVSCCDKNFKKKYSGIMTSYRKQYGKKKLKDLNISLIEKEVKIRGYDLCIHCQRFFKQNSGFYRKRVRPSFFNKIDKRGYLYIIDICQE